MEHVKPLVQRSISVKLTVINHFNTHISLLLQTIAFLGGNSSKSGSFLTLQQKISRTVAAAQQTISCKSAFKQLENLTISMPVYTVINEIRHK